MHLFIYFIFDLIIFTNKLLLYKVLVILVLLIFSAIPLVKEGPVDEFLQKQGNDVKNSGVKMEKKAVMDFAALSNPYTGVFVDKMNELNLIYNHTSQICFDKENIYLFA